ncbi:MAG: hypothetical protein ACI95C_000391 [Pseudohongiellaceae bacterium]|jgi:hypothetical protein
MGKRVLLVLKESNPGSVKRSAIALGFACLWLFASLSVAQSIDSADESFAYIKSTLDTFNGTGRLVKNPGIDGADLEAFIAVLNEFDAAFREEFSQTSAMCRFYLDPNNARLTIQERAEIAFSTLSDLDRRVTKFKTVSQEFASAIQDEFGRIVLENIQEFEKTAVSYLHLPSSNFDEAAQISFIDGACS